MFHPYRSQIKQVDSYSSTRQRDPTGLKKVLFDVKKFRPSNVYGVWNPEVTRFEILSSLIKFSIDLSQRTEFGQTGTRSENFGDSKLKESKSRTFT